MGFTILVALALAITGCNLFPSYRLDFMNGRLENTWRNNVGTLGPPYPDAGLLPPAICE